MNKIDGQNLLNQMQSVIKEMQSARIENTGINIQDIKKNDNINNTSFHEIFKNNIDQVNILQNNSHELASRFEMGDMDVDINKVMVSMQKANISFQALTQVRNKLVSAYETIMNMQT